MMRGDTTATCDVCGRRLAAQDLQRGLAHTVDPRRFCTACRAMHNPPPLPTRPVAAPDFHRRRPAV
ncbi:MAG TPA: hypothetical protein VEJ18_09020 [Planctomycetota bacterium]|nr:hypothetical protein [Planctomycetota bacterium]